ncbi:MAG: nucleoside-triphosphatase [Anaerolineales bacterium]|nr:nucleoside-triphosphatase [Anaerolineales bacterium]
MDLNNLPPVGDGRITVVTGGRNAGKTSYCLQRIEACPANRQTVAGLLSPGRFDHGQKTGFFALNLRSLETRLAASAVAGELSGVQIGPWTFDSRVFEWGNRCLSQADGADVLMIDELGPLEFTRQIGWMASFDLLRRRNYRLALVVIRPECLDAFSAMGFTYDTKEITPS